MAALSLFLSLLAVLFFRPGVSFINVVTHSQISTTVWGLGIPVVSRIRPCRSRGLWSLLRLLTCWIPVVTHASHQSLAPVRLLLLVENLLVPCSIWHTIPSHMSHPFVYITYQGLFLLVQRYCFWMYCFRTICMDLLLMHFRRLLDVLVSQPQVCCPMHTLKCDPMDLGLVWVGVYGDKMGEFWSCSVLLKLARRIFCWLLHPG